MKHILIGLAVAVIIVGLGIAIASVTTESEEKTDTTPTVLAVPAIFGDDVEEMVVVNGALDEEDVLEETNVEVTEDADEKEGIEKTTEGVEEDDEVVENTRDTSGNTLYTNSEDGYALSIPSDWTAPGTTATANNDSNRFVQAHVTDRAAHVLDEAENGPAQIGSTVAEHDAIVSDLQGTATTTKWQLSADLVVPVTTLENGARAYFYYGGTEGGLFVKEYAVLTPNDELLIIVVNPEVLFHSLYPQGRPDGLVTPKGTLSGDAEQDLKDLFDEFDEIVNSLEWTE